MIYMDNAATTLLDPEVAEAMKEYMSCGNPSSVHDFGLVAKDAIEKARIQVAAAINAEPEQIVFISGATEGCAWFSNRYGAAYVSEVEHHAVLNAKHYAEISLSNIRKCKVIPGFAYSIMAVNNETGEVFDTYKLSKQIHESTENGLFFVDATAAVGKIPIDVTAMNVDYLVASAHKFHGPKGVGFIYMKEPLTPMINGGGQEFGLRAGTENVAGIVGCGYAIKKATQSMDQHNAVVSLVSQHFQNRIKTITDCEIWRNGEHQIPHILNYTFKGVRSEELIEFLNMYKIYVSAGSACNSSDGKPSHVLKACGLSDDDANSSIRFSLDYSNTKDEVDMVIETLREGIKMLK